MIAGVITGKEILLHAPSIVRDYGVRRYMRFLRAAISRRRMTFLELIW